MGNVEEAAMRMIPQITAVNAESNVRTQGMAQNFNPAILSKAWDLLKEAQDFRARYNALVAKQTLALVAYGVNLSWVEDEVKFFETYALLAYKRAIQGLDPGPRPRLLYGHVG